jgi:hypothetical protein
MAAGDPSFLKSWQLVTPPGVHAMEGLPSASLDAHIAEAQ